MLATSVLDRFSAPLCDEVIEGTGSAAMLNEIERSNSFLIALDNRREWYRYHHLFRELLRNELASTDPAGVVVANQRAAGWLSNRGWVSEAIPHLIAAGDVEEAGELIASSWLAYGSTGAHETVRAWLELLPPAVHDGDSRLCVASAVMALSTGRLDGVRRWIDQAARAPAGGPFHDGFRSGAAAADCLRTVQAWLLGDLEACRTAGETAIRRALEPSQWDGVTYTWLGASRFWLGHPEEGIAALQEGLRRSQAAGFHPPWVACLSTLGLIHHLQGDQDAAREFSEEAMALSARSGMDGYSRLTTAAHLTRAGLLTADERKQEAREELEGVIEMADRGSGPVEIAYAQVSLSIAAHVDGDADRARRHLSAARSVIRACPDPGPVVKALLERAEQGLAVSRRPARTLTPFPADFSEREMAVLRLLAGTLSQREIAGLLFISINTVKTHTRSIFQKLGVGTRTDAVARARELRLIH
jgi:LuxR family maltose regulon positive regulatory protein